MLIVSLFPLFISAPEWNFALMLFLLFLLGYSRVSLNTIKIYIPVAISMGSIILISYTILGGTHPDYHLLSRLGPVNIYWERVRDALVIYFRILPMILTMVFFL